MRSAPFVSGSTVVRGDRSVDPLELLFHQPVSAVIMDLDTDPSDPLDDVRHTKARVRDEAAKDEYHRAAIFSVGREIENDVDPAVFKKAVAALLDVTHDQLTALVLTGSARYPDEVTAHLKVSDTE